jgi:uncharacterized protein YkwD
MPASPVRSLVLTLLAALALPLGPALVGASSGAAEAAAYRNAPNSYEQSILYWTNVQRKRHGVRPLTLGSCVDRYAESWGRHLASTNTFYHQSLSPIMRTCDKRAAGENLGKGNVSARRMVQLWMNSAGHRRNLLNPHYHHIGIGSVYSGGGTLYTVQDFVN